MEETFFDQPIIDRRNFFDQPIKTDLRTHDNIRNIAISQGDDYTAGWLVDYPHFKNYYKLIATDLSKQKKLYSDPKAIQETNFTGNLDRGGITQMFFIIGDTKETVLGFLKGTVKVL